MALVDGRNDPLLDEQLYGTGAPSLVNALPPQGEDPWSWVPDGWNAPDAQGGDELRRQHIGPDAAPAGPETTAPPQATPPVEMGAPLPPPPPVLGPPDPNAPPTDGSASGSAAPLPPFSDVLFGAAGVQPPGAGGPLPLPYGAEGPPAIPAGGPPQLGPPAPSRVADLPDISIHNETHAEQFDGHPWDNPVQSERDAAARSMAINDPAGFQDYVTHLSESKEAARASAQAQADQENLRQLRENAAMEQRAYAAAQAKSDAILADSKALSSRALDRGRWFRNLSTGGKIAAAISAVVGGLLTKPGGANPGLDFVTKHIDDDINDQKADIESGRANLADRRGAVAQEFARTGDLFRATETVRLASYQAALNKLQTVAQDYDPNGTSYANIGRGAQQLQGQIVTAHENVRKTAFDEGLKLEQVQQTATVNAETRRHNKADEALAWAKEGREAKKDAGAVDMANPNYTVPTGFFNPFNKAPVLGKRPLGGKGEDPEERKRVEAQLNAYYSVQRDWAELQAIGARINYRKNIAGTWSKFENTDTKEYNGLRHKIAVDLVQGMGDKLTQGQIDSQGERVPELNAILESRDVGSLIGTAQERSDSEFAGRLNVNGLDAAPIITEARKARKPPPQPSALDAADAAQQAQQEARTPGEKRDAAASAQAAQGRIKDRIQDERDLATAAKTVATLQPLRKFNDTRAVPPPLAAALTYRNEAVDTYDQALKQAHESPKDGQAARRALRALDVAKEAHAKAFEGVTEALTAGDETGIDAERLAEVARYVRIDPARLAPPDAPKTPGEKASPQLGRLDLKKRLEGLTYDQQSHVLRILLAPPVAHPSGGE